MGVNYIYNIKPRSPSKIRFIIQRLDARRFARLSTIHHPTVSSLKGCLHTYVLNQTEFTMWSSISEMEFKTSLNLNPSRFKIVPKFNLSYYQKSKIYLFIK